MKISLLLSVGLFIFANADSSERRPWEEDLEDFAKFIKDQFNVTMGYEVIKLLEVVEGKCPTIAEKMEFASDEYMKCMSGKVFGSETLCSAVRNNWATCSKPGVDVIANSLLNDKDFPIMIGKIAGALIELICESTGSEVLEFFNPCINAISSRDIPECAETVRIIHKPKKNTLPTKETICFYNALIPIVLYVGDQLECISCKCRTGCGRACGCQKAGLDCTVICENCTEKTCTNQLKVIVNNTELCDIDEDIGDDSNDRLIEALQSLYATDEDNEEEEENVTNIENSPPSKRQRVREDI